MYLILVDESPEGIAVPPSGPAEPTKSMLCEQLSTVALSFGY